jgi:hypothetical protein
MTPRLWALSLAPLLAATTAYAQAPGDYSSESYYAPPQRYAQPPPSSPYYAPAPPPSSAPYYAPAPPSSYAPAPAPAPAPASPCGYAASPVMARRWAIGLSLGRMGVTPEGAIEGSEGSETEFRITELAVRYRATRRIELEVALSGGREHLKDDTEGSLATGSVTLALRYRFRPEQRWNWFLMGGLGGSIVAPHNSTELEREDATRPLGMVGVGIERRFRRFALQAELRAVGLGPRADMMDDGDGAPKPSPTPSPTPSRLLPQGYATTYAEELNGGVLTIGASYYF